MASTASNRGSEPSGAEVFDQGLAQLKSQPVIQWPHEGFWPFEVYYAEFLRVKAHLQEILGAKRGL